MYELFKKNFCKGFHGTFRGFILHHYVKLHAKMLPGLNFVQCCGDFAETKQKKSVKEIGNFFLFLLCCGVIARNFQEYSVLFFILGLYLLYPIFG